MKKKYMPAFVVCLLILVLAVAGGAVHVISKYIPTKDRMDLNEYYGLVAEGEAALILGTEKLEQRGIIAGEEGYLPLDVVNTYLNQRYYWDAESQQILYATPSEVTSMPTSTEAGSEVWLRDGTVYLSLSYIRQYTDLDTYIYENPGRIAIQYQFSDVNTVTAKKDTYVRFRGGIKSEVLAKVKKERT